VAKRSIDSIYKAKPVRQELQLVSPTPEKKISRHHSWSWFFRFCIVFWTTILIVLLISGLLFWYGLLGEKLALIRLFLGLNGRYLVLFQNNTELRPSGGFIGSFAEVEIRNGLIKNWYFDTNIYKRDKRFAIEQNHCLPYPSSFPKIWQNCFSLRDSNWSPDFPEAASDVAWFYKQEDGNKVDGVIALDTNLFIDLLKMVGPVELPKYNLVINPNNFLKEVQYYVEKKYFEEPENKVENEPKTILKDMLPIVLERVKNPHLFSKTITVFLNNLKTKHIALFLENPTTSKIAQRYNWDGRLKKTDDDYLFINDANLGGGKSSLNVEQKIILNVQLQGNNIVNHSLTITKTHLGDGAWPDATNGGYTRVLTPFASTLISKTNIDNVDFYREKDKTSFGFWTAVAPKETKSFQISYSSLVKKIKGKYRLLVQKQLGTLPSHLILTLEDSSGNLIGKWEGEIDQDKEIVIELPK